MIYEAIDLWNSPSLEHHGVKGMKWGVRRQRESLGNRIRSWRTRRHENYIRKTFGEAAVKEGRREDAASYKYQKSGESGAVGLARATGNFVKSHKKEIAIGAAVAVGAAAAIAIAKNPGFTVKMKTVHQMRPKEGTRFADILKRSRPAMKTPVANIQAGPSVMRNTIQKQQAGLLRKSYDKKSINWGQATAKAAYKHASSAKASAKAYNNLHYLGYNSYHMNGQYTPRYTTTKGRQVSKRLVKAFGKPQVITTKFYR